MSIKNIEIQDSAGNIYYPHTDASVVKCGDKTVAEQLKDYAKQSDLDITNNNLSQISNPSLLANCNFQIAQRGTDFTITNNRLYTVDRWRAGADTGTIRIRRLDNKILRLEPAGNGNMVLNQMWTPNELDLRGQTVTLSIRFRSSHAINMYIFYMDSSNAWHGEISKYLPGNSNWATYTLTGTLPADYKYCNVEFNADAAVLSPGAWSEFAWVKLEHGSVTTPFVPRHYGEDFALCQRYYQTVTLNGITSISDSNQVHFNLGNPKMRIYAPTLKLMPNTYLHYQSEGTPIKLNDYRIDATSWGKMLYSEWLNNLPAHVLCTINGEGSSGNIVSNLIDCELDAEIY